MKRIRKNQITTAKVREMVAIEPLFHNVHCNERTNQIIGYCFYQQFVITVFKVACDRSV